MAALVGHLWHAFLSSSGSDKLVEAPHGSHEEELEAPVMHGTYL